MLIVPISLFGMLQSGKLYIVPAKLLLIQQYLREKMSCEYVDRHIASAMCL